VSRRKAEQRGRIAEWIAMAYLMAKGYRILGHRLRTPFGEVDVAAWKAGVLVVVEVKARATYDQGAYALGPRSQERIARAWQQARAASVLAGRWRLHAAPIRYDLIVVGAGLLPRHERGAWFQERT
jgi:putative endonuclease